MSKRDRERARDQGARDKGAIRARKSEIQKVHNNQRARDRESQREIERD